MGTKKKPGIFDCYQNALPDEPMFVLLGRDPFAPELVEMWAKHRLADIAKGERHESDRAMAQEAYDCAQEMMRWRAANLGAWRKNTRSDGRASALQAAAAEEIQISIRMSQVGGLFVADFLRNSNRMSEEGWEAVLAGGLYRAMRRVDLNERHHSTNPMMPR